MHHPQNQFLRTIIFSTIFVTLLLVNQAVAKVKTVHGNALASERCNQFTFDATKSHDPDSEDLNYLWDFGDGTTSTDPIVTHTYNQSGNYLVELSITDQQGLECSTGVTSQMIRVNIPPYAHFHSDKAACTDQEILFDASASYDDNNNKLDYKWDFGDGTQAGNQMKVTKKYTKGGEYTVRLTVNDNDVSVCNTQTKEEIIHINEPPIADAGLEEILRCVENDEDFEIFFDASRSKDMNDDPLTYVWDFGDGQRGGGQKVKHTYANIGTYDAKLIVNDPTNLGCGTGIDFVTVRLNKRPKANAGEDFVGCVDEEIEFDGTKSFTERPETTNATWYFGDKHKEHSLRAKHAYRRAGRYEAKLTLSNALNERCAPSSDVRTVFVNSTPTATIESKNAVCVGSTITFDASNAEDPDGDALEYYWNFGDGEAKKGGSKVSHEYKRGGKYKVILVVDDGKGAKCSSKTVEKEIHVNTPPIADAGLNLTCCVDQSTVFDASNSTDPDGDELTFTWDFGDGTSQKDAVVNHTYKKNGQYKVTVTVDDGSDTACSSAKAGFTADVNSSPIPIITIH